MPRLQLAFLTLLSILAFAGNSLLCRLALQQGHIDPASFTLVRLFSGTAILLLLVNRRGSRSPYRGDWLSGLALFVYMAGFSLAYVRLPAATGALLLFGAVQATMIGYGFWRGERLCKRQTVGGVMAFGGLLALLSPGFSTAWPGASMLMLAAGMAWGVYSLRGRGVGDPLAMTTSNFCCAVGFAVLFSLVEWADILFDTLGIVLAVLSGALASGVGYALWYQALRGLSAIHAATVQLSVPVLVAIGGILFLGEPVSLNFLIVGVLILGGITMTIIPAHNK